MARVKVRMTLEIEIEVKHVDTDSIATMREFAIRSAKSQSANVIDGMKQAGDREIYNFQLSDAKLVQIFVDESK